MGKKYFVYNSSGVHFRPLPPTQFFVGFDPPYRSLAAPAPYAIHPIYKKRKTGKLFIRTVNKQAVIVINSVVCVIRLVYG